MLRVYIFRSYSYIHIKEPYLSNTKQGANQKRGCSQKEIFLLLRACPTLDKIVARLILTIYP